MPLFGWNERLQAVPFLLGEDHVMQWSVRQTGPGRTKHGDDSDASPGAAKRKADERICRVIPLPQAEKFLPAAFVKKIVVLLHVQRALPLCLDGQDRKSTRLNSSHEW